VRSANDFYTALSISERGGAGGDAGGAGRVGARDYAAILFLVQLLSFPS